MSSEKMFPEKIESSFPEVIPLFSAVCIFVDAEIFLELGGCQNQTLLYLNCFQELLILASGSRFLDFPRLGRVLEGVRIRCLLFLVVLVLREGFPPWILFKVLFVVWFVGTGLAWP